MEEFNRERSIDDYNHERLEVLRRQMQNPFLGSASEVMQGSAIAAVVMFSAWLWTRVPESLFAALIACGVFVAAWIGYGKAKEIDKEVEARKDYLRSRNSTD